MSHCAIQSPIFRFPNQVIYPSPVSLCFIKGFQFPHCIIKGPQIFQYAIKDPNFLIMSSKWWPVISHHVIKGSQFIIASSRDPHFPHRVIKGTWIFKIHQVYLWDMYKIVSTYIIEINVCKVWTGVYVEEGEGQTNKVMKYEGGAPESPLSMGPEHPRYATENGLSLISNIKIFAWVVLLIYLFIFLFWHIMYLVVTNCLKYDFCLCMPFVCLLFTWMWWYFLFLYCFLLDLCE